MKAYYHLVLRIIEYLNTNQNDMDKNRELIIQTFSLVMNVRTAVDSTQILVSESKWDSAAA